MILGRQSLQHLTITLQVIDEMRSKFSHLRTVENRYRKVVPTLLVLKPCSAT